MNTEEWYSIIRDNCLPVYLAFKQYIRKNTHIFDVGANLGAFTDHILNDFTDVNIHLFEVVPQFIEYNNNKYKNRNNISVLPFGLGNKNVEINVECNKNNLGHNTIVEHEADIKGRVISFDSYITQNPALIDNISLIKIDVEEYECFVFDGMQTLQSFKIKPVIVCEIGNMETHPQKENLKESIESLYIWGYAPVTFESGTQDYIFIPTT